MKASEPSLEATPCAESRDGVASGDSLLVTMTASESDALAHARQPDLLAVTQSAALRASDSHFASGFRVPPLGRQILILLADEQM